MNIIFLDVFLMLCLINKIEAHHQSNICLDPLQTGRVLGIGISTVYLEGTKTSRYMLLKGQFLEKRRLNISPKET